MGRLARSPESVFKREWKGWGAFLGTGKAKRGWRRAEDWIPVAEELARNNNGKLQSALWLNRNGYVGLYFATVKRPELFSHIDQEKPHGHHRSPEEWVKFAENMARENGGKLQGMNWLNKNGHSGISNAINARPELFDHIKRESHRKSAEEWLSTAEDLARNNGGMLQSAAWLSKNGFSGLYHATKNRPELFLHIKQERRDSRSRIINHDREP